jgi:hypothetical protein
MIIIKVMGGFGNQLFTYAVAYALAKKHSTDLILDEQIYHTFYSLRQCELGTLKIDHKKKMISNSFGYNKVSKKVYNFTHDAILNNRYRAQIIKEEEQFACQDFVIDGSRNVYLTGYWQNYRYFNHLRNDLIRQFMPVSMDTNIKVLIELATMDKPIAMHVRRGDYKNFNGGKCLSMNFYKEAIAYFRQFHSSSAPIWVFTDDVEFCRSELFEIDNLYYVAEKANLSDLEEFHLMSHCANFIIANSSFSWWAAYLSTSQNKFVVAPIVDMWTRDFFLPDWHAIVTELE